MNNKNNLKFDSVPHQVLLILKELANTNNPTHIRYNYKVRLMDIVDVINDAIKQYDNSLLFRKGKNEK